MISATGKFAEPQSSSREDNRRHHMALGSSALHFSNELCGCKEILNMQLSLLAPYLQELLSTLNSFLPLTSRGSCEGKMPFCHPWEESNLAMLWGSKKRSKPELIGLAVCFSLPCRVPLLLRRLHGEFFPGLHGLPRFSRAAGGQVPPWVSWGALHPRGSLLLWVPLQLALLHLTPFLTVIRDAVRFLPS